MQRLLHEVFATENTVKWEPGLLVFTSSLLIDPNANYLIPQANQEVNQPVHENQHYGKKKMLPRYWSHTINNFHLNSLFYKADCILYSQLPPEQHHLCEKNAMQVCRTLASLLWKFRILDFVVLGFFSKHFFSRRQDRLERIHHLNHSII